MQRDCFFDVANNACPNAGMSRKIVQGPLDCPIVDWRNILSTHKPRERRMKSFRFVSRAWFLSTRGAMAVRLSSSS